MINKNNEMIDLFNLMKDIKIRVLDIQDIKIIENYLMDTLAIIIKIRTIASSNYLGKQRKILNNLDYLFSFLNNKIKDFIENIH